jgi:hypothetical protein
MGDERLKLQIWNSELRIWNLETAVEGGRDSDSFQEKRAWLHSAGLRGNLASAIAAS